MGLQSLASNVQVVTWLEFSPGCKPITCEVFLSKRRHRKSSTTGSNPECLIWFGPDRAVHGVSSLFFYLYVAVADLHLLNIDKNANGKVVVPWPGTVLHYYAATTIVRWEDFDLEYANPSDKYSSFGNGVTLDGFCPDNFPWVHPPSAPKLVRDASEQPNNVLKVRSRL